MWPFKNEVKLDSSCLSGVLTCDGKHHKWSRWERKTTPYALRNHKTGEFENATALIQEHTCVVCGFTEQKSLQGSDL